MDTLIIAEDADNFTLLLHYPGKIILEKDTIKVPLKMCKRLEHCKEVCPLRNKCEGTLDKICDEIFIGSRNWYFNIQEEDYSALYGIMKKIYFFPKLGVLNKRKRIFKKKKEEK